jgi:hypothetical protein
VSAKKQGRLRGPLANSGTHAAASSGPAIASFFTRAMFSA